MRAVKIIKVNKGFIVEVGCQTFVSENQEQMFAGIAEYFQDPVAAENKYVERTEQFNDGPVDTMGQRLKRARYNNEDDAIEEG